PRAGRGPGRPASRRRRGPTSVTCRLATHWRLPPARASICSVCQPSLGATRRVLLQAPCLQPGRLTRRRALPGIASATLLALAWTGGVASAHDAAAPTSAAPAFALPAPGSYELPAIARVPDFTLLDERGKPTRLLGLAPDQIAVVSFVYSRCGEGHGCPLALATP